jgi:hypothetical protein
VFNGSPRFNNEYMWIDIERIGDVWYFMPNGPYAGREVDVTFSQWDHGGGPCTLLESTAHEWHADGCSVPLVPTSQIGSCPLTASPNCNGGVWNQTLCLCTACPWPTMGAYCNVSYVVREFDWGGHHYMLISQMADTWAQAQAMASAAVWNGTVGYLAEITSLAESRAVWSRMADNTGTYGPAPPTFNSYSTPWMALTNLNPPTPRTYDWRELSFETSTPGPASGYSLYDVYGGDMLRLAAQVNPASYTATTSNRVFKLTSSLQLSVKSTNSDDPYVLVEFGNECGVGIPGGCGPHGVWNNTLCQCVCEAMWDGVACDASVVREERTFRGHTYMLLEYPVSFEMSQYIARMSGLTRNGTTGYPLSIDSEAERAWLESWLGSEAVWVNTISVGPYDAFTRKYYTSNENSWSTTTIPFEDPRAAVDDPTDVYVYWHPNHPTKSTSSSRPPAQGSFQVCTGGSVV